MNFGDKIRHARREQGITQQELADAAGVSLRTINGYENENRLPRSRELYEKLAGALNVTVNYLRTEDASYVPSHAQTADSDPRTARILETLQEIRLLFDDAALTEDDKEELMHGISEAYWISRKHS